MNRYRWLWLVMLVFAVTACSRTAAPGPQSWMDYPLSGDTFAVGEAVTVLSHHYAPAGVAEITLLVNGVAYRRDAFPTPGDDFGSLKQAWVPPAPGTYTLAVYLTDAQGQRGPAASVTIEVTGPTPVPTVATATTLPPTPTSITPTLTPTPTLTLTPTPTFTPTSTATPTFTPTPDTTPPPAPQPFAPIDGSTLACRSEQTLVWLPVDDPSGVAGYYVKLEMETQTNQWQPVAGYGPLKERQVAVQVQCGGHYRWMVRAQDGAGNFSDWSTPWYFTIQLP